MFENPRYYLEKALPIPVSLYYSRVIEWALYEKIRTEFQKAGSAQVLH
jgi:hypothetical protein